MKRFQLSLDITQGAPYTHEPKQIGHLGHTSKTKKVKHC
jgi:hypothetical protein